MLNLYAQVVLSLSSLYLLNLLQTIIEAIDQEGMYAYHSRVEKLKPSSLLCHLRVANTYLLTYCRPVL